MQARPLWQMLRELPAELGRDPSHLAVLDQPLRREDRIVQKSYFTLPHFGRKGWMRESKCAFELGRL